MKQSKKFLSVVLAVLMMLSVMPVAFAADCEHELNMDTLVRPDDEGINKGYYVCAKCGETVEVERADLSKLLTAHGKFIGLMEGINLYSTEDFRKLDEYFCSKYGMSSILDIESYIGEYFVQNGVEGDIYIYQLIDSEQHLVDFCTDGIYKFLNHINTFLEENEIIVHIDLSDIWIYENRLYKYYRDYVISEEDWYNFEKNLPKETIEKINKLEQEMEELRKKTVIGTPGTASYTDEDLVLINEYYAKHAYYYKSTVKCLEGTHNPVEAVDTEKGTHTFTCEFCGENVEKEHTWGEYVLNGDSDCTDEEGKIATCTVCTATKTAKGDHIWGEYIPNDDSNCSSKGTKTATCILCSATDTIEGDEINPKVHVNEEFDDFCDLCETRVIERCDLCGKVAHTDYTQYVCMLIHLIKNLIILINSLK